MSADETESRTTHTLHLTKVDSAKPINVIKGIRSALKAAGQTSDLRTAKQYLDKLLLNESVPVTLVVDDDLDIVQRAGVALIQDSGAAAKGEIDMTDEEISGARPDEGEEDFEYAAAKTALVLMAMLDGNMLHCRVFAKKLAETTGDDIFDAADALMFETFGGPSKLGEESDE